MSFEWPTSEQITYRLWRLRRLWVLCVLLPLALILLASLAMPASLTPVLASFAIVVIAGLVSGHIVLFPNVAHETLGLSLAATGLVLALPWVGDLALLAPAEHVQSALVLAGLGAAIVTGLCMALLAQVLQVLIYVGPAIRWRLTSQADIACSAAVAHRQYALRPQIRRGRILTGQADANGLFDVAIASVQVADPLCPHQPLVARVTAKVLQSDPGCHDVLLILPHGGVTVTAQRFVAQPAGCRVILSEMPGDFTLGMHLQYWLTDQQADALTEVADTITAQTERCNGLSHGVSFLSLAGLVLSPSEPFADRAK